MQKKPTDIKPAYNFGSLLPVGRAAKLLGVCAATLRSWDKNGTFPALRHEISNYRLYRLEDINKCLKAINAWKKSRESAISESKKPIF